MVAAKKVSKRSVKRKIVKVRSVIGIKKRVIKKVVKKTPSKKIARSMSLRKNIVIIPKQSERVVKKRELVKPKKSSKFTSFIFGLVIGGILVFSYTLFIGFGANQNNENNYTVVTEVDSQFVIPENVNVPDKLNNLSFEEFWEVWQEINENYVPEPIQYLKNDDVLFKTKRPNNEEILKSSIDGITWATRDRYTNFFLPSDATDFEDEIIDGEIDGIGAYLTLKEGGLTIVGVIDDGPAKHAGLEAEDVVLEIDGIKTYEYNLSEAIDNIRGKRGTVVDLLIYRESDDDEFNVKIERSKISIPTIETEVKGGVFIISVKAFSKQTTKDFREALVEFVSIANAGGGDRLLIDLRNNFGGIVSGAVNLSGMFLPKDSAVFYEYSGDEDLKAYLSNGPIFKNNVLPKITLLVNGTTASSSEIMAAALKYYEVADIVGTQTLGKGSVQALKSIGDNNALLKITVAHWLTPGKVSVGGVGITPDIDFGEDLDNVEDVDEYMLNRAIEHLKNK